MATYSVLPAELNLAFVIGDEFILDIDLSFDATGYSWTAQLYESSTTFVSGAPVIQSGATSATFNIETVSAAAGQYTLTLVEAQTAGLLVSTAYRWFLRGVSPGGVTRTYLSGSVRPTSP
jgi:hypothetical protein